MSIKDNMKIDSNIKYQKNVRDNLSYLNVR